MKAITYVGFDSYGQILMIFMILQFTSMVCSGYSNPQRYTYRLTTAECERRYPAR